MIAAHAAWPAPPQKQRDGMTSAPKRMSEMGIRISQEPASADRCRLAALALQKQGRIDQAIQLYLRGLAINPSDAAAYRCLGTAYKTQKRFDLAVACFRRAVELCPAFPEAWNNLGNTLTEQKDDAGAAACYERAFTVQPQFAGAHFNFAQGSDDWESSTTPSSLPARRPNCRRGVPSSTTDWGWRSMTPAASTKPSPPTIGPSPCGPLSPGPLQSQPRPVGRRRLRTRLARIRMAVEARHRQAARIDSTAVERNSPAKRDDPARSRTRAGRHDPIRALRRAGQGASRLGHRCAARSR